MTISEYVDALRRGWIIVVAAVLVALAAGTAFVARNADVYVSNTEMFVAPASTEGNVDLVAQRAAVSANRVKSYVNVVSGDVVRNQVDEAVGGIGDASVSVVVPLDTVILSVSVTSADPEHAAEVAAAYAEVASDVIEEIETPDDANSTVKVTTVDEADVPTAAVSRSLAPVLGAAGILGLGLGLTIAVLREVVRRERTQPRSKPTRGGDS